MGLTSAVQAGVCPSLRLPECPGGVCTGSRVGPPRQLEAVQALGWSLLLSNPLLCSSRHSWLLQNLTAPGIHQGDKTRHLQNNPAAGPRATRPFPVPVHASLRRQNLPTR